MPNMRTHVVLPGDLVAAIDHLVGKRGRSSFLKQAAWEEVDRKSTRLNSSHLVISYAVFCLKKKRHVKQPRQCADKHLDGRDRSFAREPRDRLVGQDDGLQPDPAILGVPHRAGLFFNDTGATEIYALSQHGALPF